MSNVSFYATVFVSRRGAEDAGGQADQGAGPRRKGGGLKAHVPNFDPGPGTWLRGGHCVDVESRYLRVMSVDLVKGSFLT